MPPLAPILLPPPPHEGGKRRDISLGNEPFGCDRDPVLKQHLAIPERRIGGNLVGPVPCNFLTLPCHQRVNTRKHTHFHALQREDGLLRRPVGHIVMDTRAGLQIFHAVSHQISISITTGQ